MGSVEERGGEVREYLASMFFQTIVLGRAREAIKYKLQSADHWFPAELSAAKHLDLAHCFSTLLQS